MADYDFPEDLLKAQLAYYQAETAVEKAAAALPSSVAILNKTLTDEQRTELPKQKKALADARVKRDQAFVALKANEWWGQDEQRRDPYAAWKALQAAARARRAKALQEEANP